LKTVNRSPKKSALITTLLAAAILGKTAEANPPGAAGEPIPHVNHVVQEDETLFGIAEKYYDNGYEWQRLHEYNPGVDPDRLVVGQTIFIPNPSQDPTKSHNPGVTRNPGSLGDINAFFAELGRLEAFGLTIWKLLMLVAIWFMAHSMIQGTFIWFAAHMAFVKEVSLKKAMRATFQSESLATVFVFILAVMGLLVVFFDNGPPGESLKEIVTMVEGHLQSDGGVLAAGSLIVLLYGFLGIRFIPQAFQTSPGQGFAVVLVAILLPHAVFLYLLGSRFGYI
jgi:LysM repeat protein